MILFHKSARIKASSLTLTDTMQKFILSRQNKQIKYFKDHIQHNLKNVFQYWDEGPVFILYVIW